LLGFVAATAAASVPFAGRTCVAVSQPVVAALAEWILSDSASAAGKWLRFIRNDEDTKLVGFAAVTAAPNASCSVTFCAEANQLVADVFATSSL